MGTSDLTSFAIAVIVDTLPTTSLSVGARGWCASAVEPAQKKKEVQGDNEEAEEKVQGPTRDQLWIYGGVSGVGGERHPLDDLWSCDFLVMP